MDARRSETGQHQPRPLEACHCLLPINVRCSNDMASYVIVFPQHLPSYTPGRSGCALPWYVFLLTIRYTSMPVQQSPQSMGNFLRNSQ